MKIDKLARCERGDNAKAKAKQRSETLWREHGL